MDVRGARGLARRFLCVADATTRARAAGADEDLAAKVRASFLASDRTYGARRVWHDMIAERVACGLHRIERLMRLHGLRGASAPASPAARSG